MNAKCSTRSVHQTLHPLTGLQKLAYYTVVSAHQQCKLWRTCLEGERGSMGVAKLSACCSESALLIPADKQDLTQAASSTDFAVTKYTGKTLTFCQASTGFVQHMLYTSCCSVSCTLVCKAYKATQSATCTIHMYALSCKAMSKDDVLTCAALAK